MRFGVRVLRKEGLERLKTRLRRSKFFFCFVRIQLRLGNINLWWTLLTQLGDFLQLQQHVSRKRGRKWEK